MPDEARELEFSVEIEGGETVRNVKAWSISTSYLTPTDAFSFTVFSDDDPGALRDMFRPWQPVKLYLGGKLQLSGRIDSNEGSGPGEKALTVRGRDYLADLVDGGADPSTRIAKDETLQALVLRVGAPYGITEVVGDGFSAMRNAVTGRDSQGTPSDFRAIKTEAQKAGENDGAFAFLNRILARHGGTLQPTPYRHSVAIAAPDYTQGALYRFARDVKTGQSNIISGVAARDYTDVPTVTVARGRAASSGGSKASATRSERPTFGQGAANEIGNVPEVQRVFNGIAVTALYDPDSPEEPEPGKLYRPMFFTDKEARNGEQLDRGLRRDHAKRLSGTLTYRVDLHGVSGDDGAVYSVDTMAEVDDSVQAVHERMWVVERQLRNSGSGPTTSLRLLRPGSFVL